MLYPARWKKDNCWSEQSPEKSTVPFFCGPPEYLANIWCTDFCTTQHPNDRVATHKNGYSWQVSRNNAADPQLSLITLCWIEHLIRSTSWRPCCMQIHGWELHYLMSNFRWTVLYSGFKPFIVSSNRALLYLLGNRANLEMLTSP